MSTKVGNVGAGSSTTSSHKTTNMGGYRGAHSYQDDSKLQSAIKLYSTLEDIGLDENMDNNGSGSGTDLKVGAKNIRNSSGVSGASRNTLLRF